MSKPIITTTVKVDNEIPIKQLIDNVVIRNHYTTKIQNLSRQEPMFMYDMHLMRFCLGRAIGHSALMRKFFLNGLQVQMDNEQITNGQWNNCLSVLSTLAHRKNFIRECQINRKDEHNSRVLTASELERDICRMPMKIDTGAIEFILIDDMQTSMRNTADRNSPVRTFARINPDHLYGNFPNLKGIIVFQ
ncbi:ATP-dependent Clp protease proteolytic subunit [Vibrio phage VAP7]|uniref:ATP-dependent Clp protease proteolytic subunit n=1 Tax=Vibrio phage VAP7 TaxID=2584487 RepID=A0A4Y5TXC5_9CAUD|nr:ATP-dependent Clp protease proteolytic subunit [Vibrio phage VAP7]QDB73296.1 ATP-dependent Clp protease proteolytic subunit [Vibrio phage VAP7]UFD98019.1 hypothetical protein [Vibrio phage BX-1]